MSDKNSGRAMGNTRPLNWLPITFLTNGSQNIFQTKVEKVRSNLF